MLEFKPARTKVRVGFLSERPCRHGEIVGVVLRLFRA